MNYIFILIFLSFGACSFIQAQEIAEFNFENQPVYTALPNKNELNTSKIYRLRLENPGKIPLEIANLKNLQSLTIIGNDWDYSLDSLPASLANLKELRHFSLFNTNVKNLGDWLKNCKRLISIELGRNKLDSLPNYLSQLPQLKQVSLLDYVFPLPPLPYLEKLSLYYDHTETTFKNWPFQANQKFNHLIINALHPDLLDQAFQNLEPLKKLEVLTIQSHLLAKTSPQLIHLQQLKELNLENYQGKAQTLSFLVNLKKLSIKDFKANSEAEDIKLLQTIAQLPYLESFETNYRPEHLPFYTKFKKLHLHITDQYRLTENDCRNLAQLAHLQSISLSEIPPFLPLLQQIKSLDLSQFKYLLLDVFIQKIIALNNVEHLTLSASTINNQWDMIRQLKNLKTLTITNCRNNLPTDMQISLQEIFANIKILFVY